MQTPTVTSLFDIFCHSLNGVYPDYEVTNMYFIVMETLCNYSKADVIARADTALPLTISAHILDIITRLEKYEPLQYILGKTEFYSLTFAVSPDVLIPRGETEGLVHKIIQNHKNAKQLSILDVGTGSGCIAVSLAKQLDCAKVLALDISQACLNLASRNAENNGVEVEFCEADILDKNKSLPFANLDIVVSNPPYVLESEKEFMLRNVLDYEPHTALFVDDDDALIFYQTIAAKARHWLKSNGMLYFEINENYGRAMQMMLEKLNYRNIKIHKDIHEKDRFAIAML